MKSDAFEKFKEYVAEFGIPTEDGEQTMEQNTQQKKIKDYCSDSRIKEYFTVPETPQQNGVAERFNRTPVEMRRSLLIQAKGKSVIYCSSH